jgi:hypothetical protein
MGDVLPCYFIPTLCWLRFRCHNYPGRNILLVRRSFSEAGRIAFLFTCFLFISHFSFSQATIYNWDKTIGGNADDILYAIEPTSDGGTILIGSSYSALSADKSEPSQGSSDYWLVKLDATGNKTWDKTLGGLGDDIGTCIRQLPGGGYIVAVIPIPTVQVINHNPVRVMMISG